MYHNNKKQNLYRKVKTEELPDSHIPKADPRWAISDICFFQAHALFMWSIKPQGLQRDLWAQQRQKWEFAYHVYSASLVSLSSNRINHTCSLIPNQEALESDFRDMFYGSSCIRYENEKCLTHPTKMCIHGKSKWSDNETRLDFRWQNVKRKT